MRKKKRASVPAHYPQLQAAPSSRAALIHRRDDAADRLRPPDELRDRDERELDERDEPLRERLPLRDRDPLRDDEADVRRDRPVLVRPRPRDDPPREPPDDRRRPFDSSLAYPPSNSYSSQRAPPVSPIEREFDREPDRLPVVRPRVLRLDVDRFDVRLLVD